MSAASWDLAELADGIPGGVATGAASTDAMATAAAAIMEELKNFILGMDI